MTDEEKKAAEEAARKAAEEKAAKEAAEAAEAAAKNAAEEKAKKDAEAAAKKEADEKAEKERKEAEAAAEKEKGAKLTDTERKLLHEVMERKERERAAKTELEEKTKKLAEYEKAQKDAEEKAAKEKAEKEKKDAEKAGDFERVKKMMAEEHKREIEAILTKQKENESKLADSLKLIDDLTVGQAFASSSFVNEELVLTPQIARQVYGSHFEIENGKLVAYDKPKNAAERTKLVNGSGDPYGFEDAMKKLVESSPDRDKLIRSKMKEGAHSRTTNDRTRTNPNTDQAIGRSRISAALENGALKLKA